MSNQDNVPLTGKPVFDQELYGGAADKYTGYDQTIGVDDEEQDERERALARWGPQRRVAKPAMCSPCWCHVGCQASPGAPPVLCVLELVTAAALHGLVAACCGEWSCVHL